MWHFNLYQSCVSILSAFISGYLIIYQSLHQIPVKWFLLQICSGSKVFQNNRQGIWVSVFCNRGSQKVMATKWIEISSISLTLMQNKCIAMFYGSLTILHMSCKDLFRQIKASKVTVITEKLIAHVLVCFNK